MDDFMRLLKNLPIRHFIIPLPDGQTPYLERFILDEGDQSIPNERRSRVYLHIIYEPDSDRDPHDHPFDFESTILWGRYKERTYVEVCANKACWSRNLEAGRCRACGHRGTKALGTGDNIYGPGHVNEKRAADLHRIVEIEGPVVTLVRRGPKVREWGFQTDQGWEHHAAYIARKFPKAMPVGEVD